MKKAFCHGNDDWTKNSGASIAIMIMLLRTEVMIDFMVTIQMIRMVFVKCGCDLNTFDNPVASVSHM